MSAPKRTSLAFPAVLGAPVDITVDAHPNAADQVERAMLDEIGRLERVFSSTDPASELSRWRSGAVPENPGTDLGRVLTAAERFWAFSGGAFHPGAAPLVRRWREAEASGVAPTAAEMADLAATLQLPFTAVDGPIRRIGDCAGVDLGPIARGYVLDCALDAGWRLGLASTIWLAAGGDQRQRGKLPTLVRLSDVFRTGLVDAELTLQDAALSRSEFPRSAFQVGRRRFRNVLDPRTGWPNADIVAVAALAPDAMTAGVIATVVSVGSTGKPTALPGTAWVAVHADGTVESSGDWPHVGGTEEVPARG